MTREQIELLDGIIISEEQVELIELNPEVTTFECLGASGYVSGCNWYSVEFEDGESIDVYMR